MTRNPDCNLCHGSGTITGTGTSSNGKPCASERQATGSPENRAIDDLHRRLTAVGVDVPRDALVASIWREGYLPIVQRLNRIEIDIRHLAMDIGEVAGVTSSGGKVYKR